MSLRHTAIDRVIGPLNEEASAPSKVGNVQISRQRDDRGCSYCFPHGLETANSTIKNRQRSWKKHRRTKFRERKRVP